MSVKSARYFNLTKILKMCTAAGPKVSFLSNNTQKMFFFLGIRESMPSRACMKR